MRIKYLGTAAAEGWPAIFCQCDACKKARELGGKNIRRRAQVLINDDMMIDLNSDNFSFSLDYNIDLSKIAYMPITHSHSDHFIIWDLELRGSDYAHNMTTDVLNIYANKEVYSTYKYLSDKYFEDEIKSGINCTYVKPFVPFKAGSYTITPLEALHKRSEDCYIYIIEQNSKRILYANDTGIFPQSTFEYLKTLKGIKFDLVSFDCTCGPRKAGGNHMGYPDNLEVKSRLEELGLVDENTKYVITHFSHNGGMLHHELEELVKDSGFTVAYDGMEIEL